MHSSKSKIVKYAERESEKYRNHVIENFDSMIDFFTRNLDVTPSFFSGQLAERPATSDSNWGDQDERMRAQGIEPHPLLGKCYHAVRFFQYIGGFHNFEAYTIYKKIPHKLKGEFTTHWFLRDNKTQETYDPTAAQFDYLDISDYYHLGQRASGRLCYYGFNPRINIYKNFVPPITTRKLARKYKEESGSAQAMEKWLLEEEWWISNKEEYKNFKKDEKNIVN